VGLQKKEEEKKCLKNKLLNEKMQKAALKTFILIATSLS
jgi:hypothetical protein